MIDLYMFPTANGIRGALALEESGLPYTLHRIDLPKGQTKSPEFMKINPAGQIPVIVDSDGPGGKPVTVTQSNAILIYVAEKSGKLIPADPRKKLLMWERLSFVMTDVSSVNNAMVQSIRGMKEKHQPTIDFFAEKLFEELKQADRILGAAEYLAGEITIADISMYPVYARAKVLLNKPEVFARFSNVERWAAAMAARPAIQRGMKVGAAA